MNMHEEAGTPWRELTGRRPPGPPPRRARAAEAAQRDCNEAEYGRRDTLRAEDSALGDANAARNSLPLMRVLLEPQWHLRVCVRTRVTIAR